MSSGTASSGTAGTGTAPSTTANTTSPPTGKGTTGAAATTTTSPAHPTHTGEPTAPAAPKPPSAAKLVKQGWDEINGHDYEAARSLFARALQSSPGNSEGLYGRGYAAEKLGDKDSAAADYCRALAAHPTTDTERELNGSLRRIERTCP
jgi:Flp pilus assembly protein TadD